MEYLANVLPVEPTEWVISRGKMTKSLISLEAGGSAYTTLDHEDVQFTPKAFKMYARFDIPYDEFKPAVYGKLLIRDNKSMYQVFTAPFQVKSKAGLEYVVESEMITNVADFKDIMFSFFAEQPVQITNWALYPSADVDSSTLNTIESMLPQFLFNFNENQIIVDTRETEIVNLPFAMGEAGNLSCHLLFNYVASAPAKMTIQVKVDGSPEPYTPIVSMIDAGPGYVGIPHSFLQVSATAHLISVTVTLETAGQEKPTLTIPAKGVRYTVEGRGILDGASGEYPHAEASDEYFWPEIVFGRIELVEHGEAKIVAVNPNQTIRQDYYYTDKDIAAVLLYNDIPNETIKKFGSCGTYFANLETPENVNLSGNLILTADGVSFPDGVGEGIAAFTQVMPSDEHDPVINAFQFITTDNPNIRFAFGSNGSNWFTTEIVDTEVRWKAINLIEAELASYGIVPADLAQYDNTVFQRLFTKTGIKKLRVAVYMLSSMQQTKFTLNKLEVYYSSDESNTPLLPPTMTYSAGEDTIVRVHWQAPAGPPRAFRVYWGEAADSLTNIIDTKMGATFQQINNLINRKKYYAAATTLGYGRESELSNIISAVPSKNVPRWVSFVVSPSTLSLRWMTVGVVYDSFNIYMGTSEEDMPLLINVADMAYDIIDVINNVKYYITLTGIKDGEESWYSDIRFGTPQLPQVFIKDVKPAKTAIRIIAALPEEYAEYTGFEKYRLYYGNTLDTMTTVLESNELDFLLDNLPENTSFYMYIVGVHGEEESIPVEPIATSTTDFIELTTLGNTGPAKPTQEQANAQYAEPVTITNGIQEYVVNTPGFYHIRAIGAAGGKGNAYKSEAQALGGFGAIVEGDFALKQGDSLKVLVGQMGTPHPSNAKDGTTGAGGGASYVLLNRPEILTPEDTVVPAPTVWQNFNSYYYYYKRPDGNYWYIFFDTIEVQETTVALKQWGSYTCTYDEYAADGAYATSGNVNMSSPEYGIGDRELIRTNCKELIDALTTLNLGSFSEGLVFIENTVHKTLLLVAGAGNGGGDSSYSGTAGDNALLTEGTNDDYLNTEYSGGGFKSYRNSTTCGKSLLAGGDAASSVYSRNGNSSPGFGGGGSNQDDGDGGGGGGYRGGVRSSFGGSSYNAGNNQHAELNSERTEGSVVIQRIQKEEEENVNA